VALRRAGEIMESMLALEIVHDGQALPTVTTSIGIAMFPIHGKTPSQLLAQADQALYRAKSLGRNRVEVARTDTEPA